MAEKKKKEKWIKPRHKWAFALVMSVMGPFTKWKYGVEVQKFKEQGDRPYLIMMNHQTGFDQFFVAMAFKGAIYFISTEDIFSLGWVSSIIKYLAAPISIKKQAGDVQAVMNCMRVAKEGGTICLSPEGNRTYSGRTVYISPAIAKLAKGLRLPIAIFKIEGGYGVQPRWSDVVRKGKMKAYVSRVIEPEEYKSLSNDEFYEMIVNELHVDESSASGTFHHKNTAEYMERAVYVCPYCGFSEFESHGDTVECKTCGRKIKYLPTKEMEGVGFEFPFKFMAQWNDYQYDFVNKTDLSQYENVPVFCDTASLRQVFVNKFKKLLRESAEMKLYGNRVVLDEGKENEMVLSFDDITTVTVLGKNKLNIYYKNDVYQFKGSKRFNAVKYVNIYYRYCNIKKGDTNGKFLGL
ncbi:MAG: 1-acyl-sn-glycerol-3-phosphate acyltransferase [Firmicutes bacterium]|nr:1-acyl-sn-glycerol-3-phosphate acyltransferase [Bacillota bacterium]